MVDYSRSHEVMTSLVTLVNGGQQVHHILKELTSPVPLSHSVDSLNNDLINDLACVSIDEYDPLVDDMPFRSELNFDRFEHLYRPHDIVDSCLSRLLSAVLIHQNEVLDVPLDISGHIETLINEISSDLQELRVRGDITLHVLRVLQSIRVHLHYPLHELDVV